MGLLMFYHLTRSAPEDTARPLLQRALSQGWRVMIRSTDDARLKRLDERLWMAPEDEFIPHGMAGGTADADQPILIGQGAAVNRPQALMLMDGAAALDGEVAAMERVFVLFDGNDEGALNAARGQWKALTDAGHAAQYWSEETGRWEKKAEKTPAVS
jgi:DNA polymerase III subunit chi